MCVLSSVVFRCLQAGSLLRLVGKILLLIEGSFPHLLGGWAFVPMSDDVGFVHRDDSARTKNPRPPPLRRAVRYVAIAESSGEESPVSHNVQKDTRLFRVVSISTWLRPKSQVAKGKSCRCFRGALGHLSSLRDICRLPVGFHGLNVLLD